MVNRPPKKEYTKYIYILALPIERERVRERKRGSQLNLWLKNNNRKTEENKIPRTEKIKKTGLPSLTNNEEIFKLTVSQNRILKNWRDIVVT